METLPSNLGDASQKSNPLMLNVPHAVARFVEGKTDL
jgi:hypothetical protein